MRGDSGYLYGGKRMEYDLTLNISRFTHHASRITFHASRFTHHVSRFALLVVLLGCVVGLQRQGRTAPAERGVDPIGDASGGD